jgi:hypothetical protein
MRRTIFLALLAALLIAPVARADETAIYKDCQDDSRLEGHYSVSQLRQAKADLPSDVDEYSDCRDVLSRAIADKTSASSSGSQGGGGGAGGGSTGSGGSGGSGASSGSGSHAGSSPPADSAGAAPLVPSTPQDSAALTQAAAQGASPVNLDGGKIVPGGASRLAADVGRNSLPLPLVLVLIGLAAGVVGGAARRIRNRDIPHPQP